MPIKATFRNRALIGALPHIPDAAKAEKITRKHVIELWSALKDEDRNGIIAFAQEEASEGATLADWRNAFTLIFGNLNDKEASTIIRVAVAMAGGEIEEEEGENEVDGVSVAAKAKKAATA